MLQTVFLVANKEHLQPVLWTVLLFYIEVQVRDLALALLGLVAKGPKYWALEGFFIEAEYLYPQGLNSWGLLNL